MAEKIKKHTHATPQVYLRRFAIGGRLMAQRPGEEAIELGTPVVGVRKRFYTLRLSDGSSSNEIEDSLATLEGALNSAFAQVDAGKLPLDSRTEALLAEFIGTQISRGVAYRQLRREFLPSQEPMLRERVRELFRTHAPHRLAEAEEYDLTRVVDDDSALRSFIATGQLLANAIVNMRWQFVRSHRPALLSSDQPAVCWFGPHQSSPWGPTRAIEVRVPVSPTQALVASWHDGEDPADIAGIDALGAMSINHHTESHAVDWLYWQPDTKPRRAHPLHDEALSGDPPTQSVRRQLVLAHGERLLETREQAITVFTSNRGTPNEGHG